MPCSAGILLENFWCQQFQRRTLKRVDADFYKGYVYQCPVDILPPGATNLTQRRNSTIVERGNKLRKK
jgi:hypothetical protein